MKVAAFPAFKRKENPYQILLYTSITSENVTVDEFTWKHILLKKYDIIHIHWPESNKLRKTIIIAVFFILMFNCLLYIAKWKGAKIVWTVHNLHPHVRKFLFLESIHFKSLTKLVDGFIVMNEPTVHKIINIYPFLKNKPFTITPHGSYKSWYENKITIKQAKNFFNLSDAEKVFLFPGQINPYKGLERLIEVFKHCPQDSYRLIIAGEISKSNLQYQMHLEKIIATDKRIIFNTGFIPDNNLQHYFNASDVVVLPYTGLLNSGVLMLALSFNKTIVIPYFESIEDLSQTYSQWILTYKNLSCDVLNEALEKSELNKGKTVDMQDRDWHTIALQTIEFYNSLLN